MKTSICRRCEEEKPAKEFRYVDHGKPTVSSMCRTCRQRKQHVDEEVAKVPRVVVSPHFKTLGPDDLWPRDRMFFKQEFLADLEAGVWPPGLRVSDEKGRKFEVQLVLRRLK